MYSLKIFFKFEIKPTIVKTNSFYVPGRNGGCRETTWTRYCFDGNFHRIHKIRSLGELPHSLKSTTHNDKCNALLPKQESISKHAHSVVLLEFNLGGPIAVPAEILGKSLYNS